MKINQHLCLVVMGVSGAGKSTIAQALATKLEFDYLEGDQFHPEANIAKMKAGIPLTDEDRQPWLEKMNAVLKAEMHAGRGVTLASSGLKKIYRQRLLEGIENGWYIYLKVSRPVLEKRLRERHGHFMPVSLLDSQLQTLEEPTADEHSIIVSADGTAEETLADILDQLQRL